MFWAASVPQSRIIEYKKWILRFPTCFYVYACKEFEMIKPVLLNVSCNSYIGKPGVVVPLKWRTRITRSFILYANIFYESIKKISETIRRKMLFPLNIPFIRLHFQAYMYNVSLLHSFKKKLIIEKNKFKLQKGKQKKCKLQMF